MIGNAYLKLYDEFVGINECPRIFHLWSAIAIVGAILSRRVKLKFGHGFIYPNQYILLTGGPGARKGTAIRIAKNLAKDSGYNFFAPNKAAKEALWQQMSEQNKNRALSLDFDLDIPTELFIAQDEFVDFIGIGNDDLITNLTNLWDNLDEFINPKQTREDVVITSPTINILSGSAPGTINEAFTSLALNGGFFSRVLLVSGAYKGEKVTWPTDSDPELKAKLIAKLKAIRELQGEIILDEDVKNLLDKVYKSFPGIKDKRFDWYAQRRFTHLLKLVMILAASRLSLRPTKEDVIEANTLLHGIEIGMPTALGEYGKSRYSEVTNAVVDIIGNAKAPINSREIWKRVSHDVDKITTLNDILQNLIAAEKIQVIRRDGRTLGYLPLINPETSWPPELLCNDSY